MLGGNKMNRIQTVNYKYPNHCDCGNIIALGEYYWRGESKDGRVIERCLACGIADWELEDKLTVKLGNLKYKWKESFHISLKSVRLILFKLKECDENLYDELRWMDEEQEIERIRKFRKQVGQAIDRLAYLDFEALEREMVKDLEEFHSDECNLPIDWSNPEQGSKLFQGIKMGVLSKAIDEALSSIEL